MVAGRREKCGLPRVAQRIAHHDDEPTTMRGVGDFGGVGRVCDLHRADTGKPLRKGLCERPRQVSGRHATRRPCLGHERPDERWQVPHHLDAAARDRLEWSGFGALAVRLRADSSERSSKTERRCSARSAASR